MSRRTIGNIVRRQGGTVLGGSRKAPLTEEIMQLAGSRYLAGETALAIATDLGCSRATLLSKLRERGVAIRHGRQAVVSRQVAESLPDLYRQGATISDLAFHLDLPEGVVARELSSAGIHIDSTRRLSPAHLGLKQRPKPPRRTSEISEALEAEILTRYQAGDPPRDIADDHHLMLPAVRLLLRQHGIENDQARALYALTLDEELRTAELYRENWSMSRLAREFGVSLNTVRSALVRHGGEIHAQERRMRLKRDEITSELEDEISARYTQGESVSKLGSDLAIKRDDIRAILAERGHEILGARRKYPLREDAFAALDGDTSYWIGMLASDGGVFQNSVQLGLHAFDYCHMEAYREFLGTTGRPISGESMNMAVLVVHSARIVRDLSQYGITPAKSLNLEIRADVAEDWSFWRGAWDGDGHIQSEKTTMGLTSGSKTFIEQAARFLRSHGLDPRVRKVKPSHQKRRHSRALGGRSITAKHQIWTLTLNRDDTLLALAAMYPEGATALPRKAVRAAELLTKHAELLKQVRAIRLHPDIAAAKVPHRAKRVAVLLREEGPLNGAAIEERLGLPEGSVAARPLQELRAAGLVTILAQIPGARGGYRLYIAATPTRTTRTNGPQIHLVTTVTA